MVFLGILPPYLYINIQENGYSQPDHHNEKEKGISNIACHVSYQANN